MDEEEAISEKDLKCIQKNHHHLRELPSPSLPSIHNDPFGIHQLQAGLQKNQEQYL